MRSKNLFYQHFSQRVDSLFFIGTFRDQADTGSFGNTHGEYTQHALGIDAALIHLNPDAGLEFIGFLNKVCSLPVVQA